MKADFFIRICLYVANYLKHATESEIRALYNYNEDLYEVANNDPTQDYYLYRDIDALIGHMHDDDDNHKFDCSERFIYNLLHRIWIVLRDSYGDELRNIAVALEKLYTENKEDYLLIDNLIVYFQEYNEFLDDNAEYILVNDVSLGWR